mmetsp:Transcript_28898/g.73359  ORF Transcript_28898/g.73359 Transcript_28898/m.73359 type:complete len:413 (+) Transcript_28898:139-1377(+)
MFHGGEGDDERLQLGELDEDRQNMDERFLIVEKLGEGTYGKVYKAIHKVTQEAFALKKIKIVYDGDGEGVPGTAIREVSLLKECDHVNVIKLYEVFFQPNALYLLFEFADMDLRAFLKPPRGKMSDPLWLKNASCQLFCGIEFCHGKRILHRDLKPQNVLVNVAASCLKLADFGLARAFSIPLRPYTHEVVTLWYRAPEILLGQCKYATPMDIWSLGCIVAEMATSQALFPGDSEIDTIFKIFQVLGTPTEAVWPGLFMLRDFKKAFPKWRDTNLESVRRQGPGLGNDGLDLLRQCMRYNPVDRPSAMSLLKHPFFDALYDVPGMLASPLPLPVPAASPVSTHLVAAAAELPTVPALPSTSEPEDSLATSSGGTRAADGALAMASRSDPEISGMAYAGIHLPHGRELTESSI